MRYVTEENVMKWVFISFLSLAVVLIVFLFSCLFYSAYADDKCLSNGYHYAKTTITGDIYCYGKNDGRYYQFDKVN